MNVSDAQVQAWLQMALWPMVRIGGMLMVVPGIGGHTAPARIRLMLTLTLTLLLAPLLPKTPALEAFSAAWWLRTAQELLLGVALGFLLQLAFEAIMLGSELIGSSMGLGFARLADPVRGTSAPVVGEFLQVMTMLLFFTAGGHLRLIQVLADSFHTAPVAGAVLSAQSLYSIAAFASQTFAGALSVALPMVGALLLVNVAFGVMSRSSPALNGLSVGFPLSLIAGLVLMRFNLPAVVEVLSQQLNAVWAAIAAWIGHPH